MGKPPKPQSAIASFSATVIGMGSFLSGCASLPPFRKDVSLLEWAMLSALDSQGETKLRLPYSVLGVSAKRAEVVIRSLEKSGYVRPGADTVGITEAGQTKPAEVNAELATILDVGPGIEIRLQGMAKAMRLFAKLWKRPAARSGRNAQG